MNISNHKNTILIIIAVLLAFFGYWFFFLSKKDVNPKAAQNGNLVAQSPVAATNTTYDKEFVTSLLGLNSVNLDVSVFQSKVYQALSYPTVPFVVNYTTETGRGNPFLPIGIDTGKGQVSTQTQTTESTANPNPRLVPETVVSESHATTSVKAPSKITTPATSTGPTPKRFQ